MRISYSEEAIKDLIRLREFIEIKNPVAAQRASESIRKGITQLKEFPRLGVKVESAPDPDIVRDIIIGNYLSRYLITDSVVYILRIWHHKEDIKI
jgi:plasmid stabilization system protein ParE